MSKMGALNLELQEQANELGYSTTQEALDNGLKVQYNADGSAVLVPFLTDKEQEEAEQARRDEILDKIEEKAQEFYGIKKYHRLTVASILSICLSVAGISFIAYYFVVAKYFIIGLLIACVVFCLFCLHQCMVQISKAQKIMSSERKI